TASAQDKGNILVAVTADGQVWIDKKAVDVRSVRAHIERLRVDQPDGAVVVQADQDARTGLVVQVMDQARQAGVHDVALAATAGAQCGSRGWLASGCLSSWPAWWRYRCSCSC